MRRVLALLAMLTGVMAPIAVLAAGPASAHCVPPNDLDTIYAFRDKSFTYYPTNLKSDWVTLRKGGSITYSKSATMEVSASVTATVSAEAGIVFAKASTSLGVTVGGSKSWSHSWSYTANVPADTSHKYRLHAYHYTANFSVMKKHFSYGDCNYHNQWRSWQRVTHAPAKAERNVWRLDKAAA